MDINFSHKFKYLTVVYTVYRYYWYFTENIIKIQNFEIL